MIDFRPLPSPAQPTSAERLAEDVAAIGRIEAVKTVLRVLLQTTGLRMAVVARVTSESWMCCAVLDELNFGLRPGDSLELVTTFCNVVRNLASPLLITHASKDSRFTHHPAPKLYNVESYIAVPVLRRDGSFFGVMCAVDSEPADISEDKIEIFRHLAELIGYQLELEDELDRREALLLNAREAAQLREQLIGIVSHDLRNPLNAIGLSAATLLRRADLDDRTRRGICRILDAADRANRLIRDLLDFTQARMGQALPVKRQLVNFHTLTHQVVDEVRLAIEGRELEVECDGDGQGAWDPDRISQVLTNLLTNALQYSPDGTPIRVSTRGEGKAVILTVRNQGSPIPAEVLPTLFEPMKRGTEEGGSERRSIGLGLFIVDQLVRAHGGSIEVCSTAEEGTAFSVLLPRSV
ncbi:GAF domain-containing sensor histidine kinase [Archangium lansingense]|uniref:histidine kinase n=1 Tax=Archangium lansingense TaxID=2995310 RepID=A0ABT4APQ0_9BACT|nr:GAF domain-containing sensor histidine kinase [Archangium lansinium]MCY1083650.1 GAF domain-containing sensor histidine kinase [Archangium lansinium]